ncbi:amidase [Rhizobium sp. BK376]|uniref:amidase n=1 Tax=Rhizobium sp. BK376 TaxID=2512149 RepID=UPI0010EFD1BD|nr:amidase [Rhizobium sp. BK376]TCR82436.1 aspartyl-tRNA(Asn)/glutamyl-tRNA(Gln) amidotransferase subunit A [Rhizobium sp. BK376]
MDNSQPGSDEDIGFLGVQELGARYRDGSLSPVDVVEQALARLEDVEPHLNAVAHVMKMAAMRDAEQLASELRSGRDLGPLHGVPVAIKDIIEVRDAPTGFGSRVRKPAIANADAPLVRRLREAGAIILCKTNLLEYAYGIAHPDIGQTNNPHDTGRTSGGSSGGSAVVVAAGIVPLAVGTDTGGSIRIPASYCGIVGLKPTYGLVPTEGVFPLSWTLDHAGPLSRSVADTVIMLECLSGKPFSLSPASLADVRIGVLAYHADSRELTPTVAQNLRHSIEILKALGATIKAIDIPELSAANSQLRKIIRPEASLIHAELHAENREGYAPRTRAQVEAGFELSAVEYLQAQQFRATLRQSIEDRFAEVDVLLSPSVPFPAPIEDPEFTEDGEEGEMLSSGFANMTGQPSISIPCGMDGHLPLGLQLTGAFGADGKLLQAALAVEAALNAYRKPSI